MVLIKKLLEDIKSVNHNYPEGMVNRMEFSYDELFIKLDKYYIAAITTGKTLLLGIFEYSDFHRNLMLESLIPNEALVYVIIDDVRLRSNTNTN